MSHLLLQRCALIGLSSYRPVATHYIVFNQSKLQLKLAVLPTKWK